MDQQRQPVVRDDAGVATLTLTQPGRPVIVMDRNLVESIARALDELESGANDLAGFVLASSSRVFVAGADLQQIMALSDQELDDYIKLGQEVLGRIAALPCTSIAAINGAALGGGLEIALHCDHLIATRPQPREPGGEAKPYPIGLPEASLSICPGWGGTNTFPARMDPAKAIRLAATGKTLTVFEASEVGLVAELAEPDQLLGRARELAKGPRPRSGPAPRFVGDDDVRGGVATALDRVASELPDTQASGAVQACVGMGLDRGWNAALEAEREHLVRLRGTEEARSAIESFFESSSKAGSKRS